MTWTTRPRFRRGPLATIEAGEGRSVVLIHGVGLRAEAFSAQANALASVARVMSIDLPGHGESPAQPADSLADYTDVVAQVWPERCIVIGHSMGAVIALDLALRYPKVIAGIVALNAIFERSSEASVAVQARANALDGVTPADPTVTLTRWFGDAPSPEREACARWLTDVDPAAYKSAYTAFAHHDGPDRAALSSLDIPTLFITGEDEPNSTPAMSRTMADLARQGTARIVAGAAHMMPMTHPGEVNAHLLSFLETCPH
ncbi:MAG: alpha/beta hydrolase [Pseudomonadota bacterium]